MPQLPGAVVHKTSFLQLDKTEWQRRLSERIIDAGQATSNLDDEIGTLCVTLERILHKAETDDMLIAYADEIMAITDKLEKLKRTNLSMKEKTKQLITEGEAKQLAGDLLSVVITVAERFFPDSNKDFLEAVADGFEAKFSKLKDGGYNENTGR